MKSSLACALLFCTLTAYGEDTTKIPTHGWKHGLVTGLTLTQVAFTDWAQGGENALAYTIFADGKSVEDEEVINWTTAYKFAFGQTRLGAQGLRKTDDILDLSAVFMYKAWADINPYAAATMKTQFAKGFAYDASGSSTEISQFFDPAYLTQSIGFGYQPVTEIKTRFGVGLREVITSQFNQYTDDPTTPGIEKTTIDGGFESVTDVEWNLAENMLFKTQLELFDPLHHLDEVIVRNTTTITAKVNKYISTMFSLQLVNEKRVSPKTQVKESIALGLSYTLF
ncbi:MAG: DUF3078 domain-containing protein [Ignavibacteria bacterium]|nr:DUF3078 domain-containing protein [Ignavibacteria bacterium]